MNELKPCPYCGEEHITTCETTVGDRATTYAIICTACAASIERPTMEEAVTAWNRRVDNDQI